MRKRTVSAAAVVISLLLLAGCGSSEVISVKTELGQTDEEGVSLENPAEKAEVQADVSSGKEDKGLEAVREYGRLKVGCRTDVKELGFENTETGELEGLEIELAYAAAAKIFHVTAEKAKEQKLCEFSEVTASMGMSLLESGGLDLVIAGVETVKERQDRCSFSMPYLEDQLGMMCLNGSGFETGENLNQAVIGVEQGSGANEELLAYFQEKALPDTVEIQEFDSTNALSAALKAGNIDIFAAGSIILEGYWEDGMTILPDQAGKKEYAAAAAKDAPVLVQIAEQVIKEWKESGRLQ